jgi:hypothetical protein
VQPLDGEYRRSFLLQIPDSLMLLLVIAVEQRNPHVPMDGFCQEFAQMLGVLVVGRHKVQEFLGRSDDPEDLVPDLIIKVKPALRRLG